MKENIKDILELFVEKADELKQEEFTRFLEEFGHQLSYQYTAASQQLTVATIAPTETMNKSFLLTYRMFVHARDNIGFIDPTQRISKLLSDDSLSPQWREQFQDVAQKIHQFLREKPSGRIDINLLDPQGNKSTESLTRWDILKTFLYGEYSHTSQRERLRNWLSTPFAAMFKPFLMMEFTDILVFTLNGIQYLAHYARLELALP